MKRILTLALVILMTLSLAACGADKTSSGDFTKDSPEIIQLGKIGDEISAAYDEVMALAKTNGWIEDPTFTEEAAAVALAAETCTQLVAKPPKADEGVDMPGVIKAMEELRDLTKGELKDRVSTPYGGATGQSTGGLVTHQAGGVSIGLPADMAEMPTESGYLFHTADQTAVATITPMDPTTGTADQITEDVAKQCFEGSLSNVKILSFDNAMKLDVGSAAMAMATGETAAGVAVTDMLIFYFTNNGQFCVINLMYATGVDTSLEQNLQAVAQSILQI